MDINADTTAEINIGIGTSFGLNNCQGEIPKNAIIIPKTIVKSRALTYGPFNRLKYSIHAHTTKTVKLTMQNEMTLKKVFTQNPTNFKSLFSFIFPHYYVFR